MEGVPPSSKKNKIRARLMERYGYSIKDWAIANKFKESTVRSVLSGRVGTTGRGDTAEAILNKLRADTGLEIRVRRVGELV